jgi:hypothetical protein
VNFLSCYENNRYRLPPRPVFLVLLGMALQQLQLWAPRDARSKTLSGHA